MTRELFDRIADYYDLLHEDVDYAAECRLLERVFARFLPRPPESVLDLGCGTGSHALFLAERGHRVTGIDASPGMLRVARAKARGRRNPAFRRADMRSFDLGRTFEAAICMDGAFTHLLTDRDLLAHLRTVRRHLAADGVYAFEFAQALREETVGPGWIHHAGPTEIVWLYDLAVDRRRHLVTGENTFFAFEGGRLQRTFVNTYSTRLLTVPVLRALLARAGLRLRAVYTTDEGSALRRLRKDDPLPLAVVSVGSRKGLPSRERGPRFRAAPRTTRRKGSLP